MYFYFGILGACLKSTKIKTPQKWQLLEVSMKMFGNNQSYTHRNKTYLFCEKTTKKKLDAKISQCTVHGWRNDRPTWWIISQTYYTKGIKMYRDGDNYQAALNQHLSPLLWRCRNVHRHEVVHKLGGWTSYQSVSPTEKITQGVILI